MTPILMYDTVASYGSPVPELPAGAVRYAFVGLIAAVTRRLDGFGRRRPNPPRVSLVGQAAPAIVGVTVAGDPVTVTWDDGDRHVVAFMTSSCRPCRAFWTALAGGATLPRTRLVVVTPGPETEARAAVATLASPGIAVVMSGNAWFAYQAGAAPWFALVEGGVVERAGNCLRWADLQALTR
jgi:hypothetical protein